MFEIVFEVEPQSKHRCQSCGRVLYGSELKGIEDFAIRVAPGESCPSGECPHCGALTQPIKERRRIRGRR